MDEKIKINQSLKLEIMKNQENRINTGRIVRYKDGKDYLVAPGFTTVRLSALKTNLKAAGYTNLAKMLP